MSAVFSPTFNILGGSLNLLDLILIVTKKQMPGPLDARLCAEWGEIKLGFGEFPLLVFRLARREISEHIT